jgi:abequosyltransferase
MKNPILSVCITTNNRSAFLKKNLFAIAKEATPEVEIVIGDDASTDSTNEVVANFKKIYPKLKLTVKKFNKRVFFDRIVMAMVESASGEFCWLLGDDDLPKAGSIKKILSVIKKYPELSLIHLNYSRFDNLLKKVTAEKMINGILKDTLFKNYEDYYFKPIKNSYFKFLGTHTITMSSDVVNRKEWLAAARRLKKYVGHNFIHSFVIGTIIKKTDSVYFVAKPQVQYLSNNHRIWPNDIWKDYNNVLLGYLKDIGYPSNKVDLVQKQQREYEQREALTKNKLVTFLYRFARRVYNALLE